MEFWLFITAVVFTLVGAYWGRRNEVSKTVTSIIDSLIDGGYLKTRGLGKDMEIIKWREWENGKAD